MKTIIFAHPWNGSFNKAILDKVVEKLDETKQKYTIIDLNKDGFNPVIFSKNFGTVAVVIIFAIFMLVKIPFIPVCVLS